MALVRDPSPVSEELIRTEQWIQATRGGLTVTSRRRRFLAQFQGSGRTRYSRDRWFSRAPDNDSRPDSKDTDAILESMENVGDMN